jgi:hypothetical protein
LYFRKLLPGEQIVYLETIARLGKPTLSELASQLSRNLSESELSQLAMMLNKFVNLEKCQMNGWSMVD